MAERKRYIDVEVPSLRSSFRVLGTAETLHLKTIRLDMSRKMRGKGLIATFQMFNKDGKLMAVPKRLELAGSYIKKMMRKRVDYVEDSFRAKCADIKVTVKPFLITRKRVSRAVRRNLRNTAREFIVEYLKEKDYAHASQEVYNSTLQKALLPKLKKVYPLSFCEIRIFETKELEQIDLETITMAEEDAVVEEQEEELNLPQDEESEEEETTQDEEEESEEEEEDDSTNTSSR